MKRQEGGYLGARPSWSTAASPGVWSLDQVLARRAAGTWPATSFLFDPYFESVNLLLHMNGSNASTTFVDSSLSNLTVTANGNAQISTAQSKFGGSSGAFDGNGDYLAVAGSSIAFGSGDWTIEGWFYRTATNRLDTIIRGENGSTAGFGLDIGFYASNALVFSLDGGATTIVSIPAATHNVTAGTWHHIAFTRSDSTWRAFVNGILVGSGTNTSSITTPTTYRIGGNSFDGTYNWNGYIDDFRITRGVARYTANFAVPGVGSDEGAALYDPYFDYVSLLLRCNGENNSTTFTDSSNNATTITRGGGAVISTAASRFGGSSVFFNGTNDSLSFPDPSLGTSDFTIEMWFKTTSSVQYAQFIGNESTGYTFLINNTSATSGNIALYAPGGGLVCQTSGTSYRDDRWHHLALTRSGSNFTIWVDGVSSATGTNASSFSGQTNYVGRNNVYTPRNLIGYIDDLRITKGVCRYTTAFRPVGPYATSGKLVDPYLTSTSLLLPMTGDNGTTSFFDRSNNFLRATENGNAKVSTAISKFGAGAAYFDGTGDYLDLNTNGAVRGTEDFTIEAWIYPTAVTGSDRCIYETRGGAGFVLFINTSGYLQVFDSVVGTASTASTTLLSANTWQHIALAGSGSTKTYYVNGVAAGTFTLASLAGPTNLRIGARNDAAAAFIGYIDDLRVTRGNARYTSSFTPPERAFNDEAFNDPHYNAVSLLLHMDGANNSTTFTDSSVNGLTVTANGDARISTAQSRFSGASAVFDGTGDSISIAHNTTLNLSAGDFTIELWFYHAARSGTQIILNKDGVSGVSYPSYGIDIDSTGSVIAYLGNGNGLSPTATSYAMGTVPLSTWTHLAITKSGTTIRTFNSGTLVASTTQGVAITDGGKALILGTQTGTAATLNGYIDELRITKGIARYTSNFTPPTLPFYNTTIPTVDPSFSSVSLLLHMSGTNGSTTFTDSSSNALTVTANGNAQISTAQSRFGGASGLFDGNGDFLAIPNNTVFAFGTGDFTIEFWFYPISVADGTMISGWSPSGSVSGFACNMSSGAVAFETAFNNTYISAAGPTVITANQWYHFAGVRSNGVARAFINGSSGTPTNNSQSVDAQSSGVNIGWSTFTANRRAYNGYIDDLRITKGVARYTSNFYIPRAAFPDA